MQNEDIAAIYKVAELLKIDESVAEKDFYVTQVIAIVSTVKHDLYDLIFQGGTSLAKAHRIIERMSEDCDFRVRFKNPGLKLSKESKRKALRQFRHDIIEREVPLKGGATHRHFSKGGATHRHFRKIA